MRLRLAAPPVGGKAKAEVVVLLASLLGLDARDLVVAAGGRSRTKTVHVSGMTPAEVATRLHQAAR